MPPKKKVKLKLVKKTKKSKLKVVKKKSRRSQAKFPALEKKYNLLSRQELIGDFDYLDKLNDKEKAWLNKFVEEEINASFNHPNPLNKTKKQRRACYTKNNQRNRDILTKQKMLGNVVDIMTVKDVSQLNPEEMMIRSEEKELEEMNNLNNGFDGSEKSKNPAQKKH